MVYLDAQIIAAGSGAIILNSARKSFFFRISSSSAFFGTRRSDFCTAVSLRLCNWSTQRHAIENGPMRMACDKVVGTDLGTNKCAIAARYRGMPNFATKSEVQLTSTPSVMACTMIGERFVRQIGKHQAVVNPEKAFLSGKWLIGRNMSKVNDELTQVPYNVIRDKNKNVKLECQPIGKQITVEETSAQVNSLLDSMKWDDKGLVVAIAQNVDTGAVLMQGFANREALEATILSSKATFYSRSRSSLWTKGETSGNFINVIDIFLDCDCDSVIYLGKPDGPTCHTGSETCYYSSIFDVLHDSQKTNGRLALSTLYSLENTISERKFEIETKEIRKPSWTRKLLQDNELLCSKIREEADELARTLLDDEDGSRAISEMGDLLYHAMVLLRLKDVKMEDVLEVLRKRFSQSGIEEKSSRS